MSSYNKKSFYIQLKNDAKMSDIFTEFEKKKGSSFNNYDFFHNGNLIDGNNSILELKKFKNDVIIIHVEKKVKIIIKCPQCICNDCILNITDYILSFSGCKYNHNDRRLFEDFNNSQKIDYTQIICGKCGKNQDEKDGDFYKCLNCTKINNRTKYFCHECDEQHKKEYKHKTVKYDEKNYYCEKHFEGNKFIKYCKDCKKDLCEKCDIDHRDHKIIFYSTIDKDDNDIEKFKKNLQIMKEKINDIKVIIEDIKDSLDGAKRLIEKYHEIASDIIKKYQLYNKELKNYRILNTIKNLEVSNKQMIKDLDKIIEEKDIKKRMDILIDIYLNDRKNFREGNRNISNNITQKDSTLKESDISPHKNNSSKDNNIYINPLNGNGKKINEKLI